MGHWWPTGVLRGRRWHGNVSAANRDHNSLQKSMCYYATTPPPLRNQSRKQKGISEPALFPLVVMWLARW